MRETIEFGAGTESVFVSNILGLRSRCNSISDEMAARMPMAYVHLVHLLVDSLLLLSPFALYPKVGWVIVPLSGLLTLFFRGLLELSKSFLDPFGNEEYGTEDGLEDGSDGNEGVQVAHACSLPSMSVCVSPFTLSDLSRHSARAGQRGRAHPH